MLYKVSELSKLLNVSQVTIYKKIKLKEMEPFIIKNKGIIFVTEEGFNLIKDNLTYKAFSEEVKSKEPLKDVEAEEECAPTVENECFKESLISLDILNNIYEREMQSLNENNEKLWLQIQEKDRQLQQKDKQIEELILRLAESNKLIENSQVLIRDKTEQDPLLQEEHFKQLDNKIESIRVELEGRQNQDRKRSWFKNLRHDKG